MRRGRGRWASRCVCCWRCLRGVAGRAATSGGDGGVWRGYIRDVVKLECEIIKSKGLLGIGKATASVDGELAVSAELTFMLEK